MATKAYYLKNREEVLRKTSDYHKTHPEIRRKANAKYREKNLARIREYNRIKAAEWRAANPELAKKRSLDNYRRHREQVAVANRKRSLRHYWSHRDSKLAYANQYRKDHPEKRRAHHALRRARKKATQVDTTGIEAWIKAMRKLPFVRCHWCGTKVHGRQIHFDHVVALSRGGEHTISNLCAACKECNLSKGARAIGNWLCNGQTFLPL